MSTLQVLTTALPTVYGLIFTFALKKMGKLKIALEEIAPDLKPVLTPSQQARVDSETRRSTYIGAFIGVGLTVVMILTTAVPSIMSWGCFDVDPNSSYYEHLQIAGLVTLGVSWFVEFWCMKAFNMRAEYLKNYFANPKSARIPRSEEEEYLILKRFPYNLWREPLAMSFHWLALSAFLLTQSWFILILEVVICILNEMVVIKNDSLWRSWFLSESFDRYFEETGSQWACGPLMNRCNKAVRIMREERMARLGELDGPDTGKRTVSVRSLDYGSGLYETEIKVQN